MSETDPALTTTGVSKIWVPEWLTQTTSWGLAPFVVKETCRPTGDGTDARSKESAPEDQRVTADSDE